MRSVNSTVFLRFIWWFLLLASLLLAFEYSLAFLHYSISINCANIAVFGTLFASQNALQKFHTTFRRSPTRAEYWRFVIFSALFAITIQAILVLIVERDGRLPPISVHFWLSGFSIAAMMFGLVAFGYSGWKQFGSG